MPAEPQPSARMLVAMQCIFLVMLLTFGLVVAHEGLQAIRKQTYSFRYTERTQWVLGPLGGGYEMRNGVLEYRGRAATGFGLGFMAVGSMLLAWAAGLGLSLLARAGLKTPVAFVRGLGVVSLVGLLAGCIALFPPWRLHMLPLYLVVAAFALAVTLPIPAETRKKVFPAAVILVVTAGFIGFPAFPLFAGIFVALVLGTNLLVIWPSLGRRLGGRSSCARRPEPGD